MSASISRNLSLGEIRTLGEEHPGDFFRLIVEPLADSFDPVQSAEYERIMQAWIPAEATVAAEIPPCVSTVYVLSRVTLGADIKIASIVLDTIKRRFPVAEIVFVANRKSAELFANDPLVRHLNADYPRKGPVSERVAFSYELRERLNTPNSIVVDPDSRMTQLGLIRTAKHFHFPSRTAGSGSEAADNLTDLTRLWLTATFGGAGDAYIAPEPVNIGGNRPRAAISLGVGENETKRIPGDFEANLIRDLATRFETLWIDRGAGGAEARRVTAAAEASGAMSQVRFWEGSFAGFASVISQCDHYAGYDSAGQHAAAAAGTALTTYFAGAPSERFRLRWAPSGRGPIEVIYS